MVGEDAVLAWSCGSRRPILKLASMTLRAKLYEYGWWRTDCSEYIDILILGCDCTGVDAGPGVVVVMLILIWINVAEGSSSSAGSRHVRKDGRKDSGESG